MLKFTNLEKYSKRGKEFLGTDYPIIGGAMSWVSEANLVAATSNAGALGVIAGASMPPHLLSQEIALTKSLTKKPFGVNLITMHPDIDALVDIVGEHKVDIVFLAGGLPSGKTIEKLKKQGNKVVCFAPVAVLGKRLIKQGADAIVIEGNEAGGHVGPVSTTILIQEVMPELIDKIPVFVAGGVGNGKAMASFMVAGASGVQIGTKLVCAEECKAHDNFKQAFIKANSRDAIISCQIDSEFPVIPVRGIENQATKEFISLQQRVINEYKNNLISKEEASLAIEHFWAGALRRAVIDGDIENGSLMAGQIVGLVKKIEPTSTIINTMLAEAEEFLTKYQTH